MSDELNELRTAAEAAWARWMDGEGDVVAAVRAASAYRAAKEAADARPVPTKPGAYYLADGSVSLVRRYGCGDLRASYTCPFVAGPTSNAPESLTWATDAAGELVPVPTLEEWREVVAERDDLRARLDALPLPRCADCAHYTAATGLQHGDCVILHVGLGPGDARLGAVDRWTQRHWRGDAEPQHDPCPAFELRGAAMSRADAP